MSSLAIAPILQAIRTIIKNHTPDNAKKLADLAGLTLKTPLPIQHEVIEHTTQKGKMIRGVVRTDLTKDQAKEIDPYTFAKDGGWFIREKHLGQTQANNEPVSQQAEVTPVANAQSDTLVSDKDNGIDALIAKFKPASTETGRATKRMDAKDGAKLLKQTLTTNFPDTKFSVVMSRGTGYGSVDVRWTDGASYDLVEVVLNHFEGKTFDGMQDMAAYKNAVDEEGNPVDYGLGYVSGHRQYSKSFLENFLVSLPENLKDLVVQHGVGIGGSDDDAYLANNNEYWVRTRLGDALSSTSTGRYSGSTAPKVQSQPEEDNSHLSLTWEKDPTRKIWRSNDGKIITDESSIVGGKKMTFFAVYQDQEEREHGNNYATGESLADAKVKAEQKPQPVTSDKLQQLIDGIKAHGSDIGDYDNFKVQYQNLDWNPYKNKIKDIARDLKLAGYPKLGGFKQLFNNYVGSVNVADLPMVEPITSVTATVITSIQDVQATPSVEAPELAGKDGYMPQDGWRNGVLKARQYARALGISISGSAFSMPVEDIVAKIDAFNLLPTAEREARLLAITGTTEERTQALSIINAVLDENPTGEFKALHDKALNEIKEKIGKPIHQIYKDYDEFDKVFANAKEQVFLAYASRLPVAIGMGSISSSLASDAHRNTSFSPERRGRSEQISFVADMVGLWEQFDRQYNAANEETQARFKEAFASIKSKAAGLKGATLSAASRTASTMITGGSGFNVSRNQKANQVAHNRVEDYLDYLQNKAPNILRKVIRGIVDDSISGQIVDMQKRIDVAKNNQEMMKKANTVIRKNANKSDDEQISALVEAGFKEDFAKKIIVIPANMSMYGKGFPSFSLTNNNANIKRMEEQLTAYKARQATAEAVQANDEEIEIAGVKVELNAQDNRIRLFFDGKPDSDTIAALKGSAFKWSPTNGAWQRQMTGNAIRAAEAILNDLAERTGQEKGALPKTKNEFNSANGNDAQAIIDAIHTVLANHIPENVKRLAMLTGLTLKKAEPDIELDMFGDPIQNNGFDLFGEPIQDGDDSPVEELPRLAIQELQLSKLTLSEDVPQFKSGVEDSDTGVVEALGGKFDRTGVAPIQVWERTDGRLEIISGRHRTDLARRSGEKTIPAQVHKESEGFTAKQAMMLDAELNIRDGQGKVKDYVDYFSHSEISEEEADKRGLLARSIGQRAFMIASKGSEELLTLHRNDIISDQAAADIANIAPNNSAMQAVGLRVLQEHKPLNNALNTIRAVIALTREKGQEPDTFDLFGFDDSALKEAEAMARIASRKQRQIAEQLTAIKGAVKNPKLAAKHGVIVENESDALAKVQTMTVQKARWDNWSSHADLLAEVRGELNNKLDAVELDEDEYYWLCREELDLIIV